MTLPSIPCTLEYTDDDGFVAFADAPSYVGYVGDWTLTDLLALFAQRSAEGSLAVQYIGDENSWVSLEVRAEPSAAAALREVSLPITITGAALWATSYTDLTMTAQFEDEPLIEQLSTEPVLALPNGEYVLTFRWLSLKGEGDPEDSFDVPNRAELLITPGTCVAPNPIPGAAALN